MWRCEKCGASASAGTVCPSCGRPTDAGIAAINRKVWRLRFLGSVSQRWTRRGFVLGFLAGIVLAPVGMGIWMVRCLQGPGGAAELAASLPGLAAVFIGAPLVLPLVGAAVGFAVAGVVRPVCVALFCSVERFEQEYGSTRQ